MENDPFLPTIRGRLGRSFALYRDLVASLAEDSLSAKLPSLPSNSIGLQLWCVVGARESYARAILENRWSGFSCSLNSTEKTPLAAALEQSAEGITHVFRFIDRFTETRTGLIIDLLEHEAAHQGQLIRYLYGLHLEFPASWKARYALE